VRTATRVAATADAGPVTTGTLSRRGSSSTVDAPNPGLR